MHQRLFQKLFDNQNANSLATRLRQSRFAFFCDYVEQQKRPLSVLDVGGYPGFWHNMPQFAALPITVTVINLLPYANQASERVQAVVGDACALDFDDGAFDLVYSNSVIEHVGTHVQQQAMATEVRRVGQGYFVQTPNRNFPIEPHFLVPFFQFMPLRLRVKIASLRPGWYRKHHTRAEAIADAEQLRLLNRQDLRQMFPDGTLWREKVAGLTKSFVVFRPIK